jgi:hypothetical protein
MIFQAVAWLASLDHGINELWSFSDASPYQAGVISGSIEKGTARLLFRKSTIDRGLLRDYLY